MNQTQRQLLGEFLRSRRALIAPKDLGLPGDHRRRTPGLRREEVAVLANVGVSWYTWLEQGRNNNPSAKKLHQIARVLRLVPDETAYLFDLAGHPPPQIANNSAENVSESLKKAMDMMVDVPAYVLNRRWDRLYWNNAALALLGDFSKDPKDQQNMVRRVFTNSQTRKYVENWEEIARTELAQFAASCARYPDDAGITALVKELNAASPEFRAWWPERAVMPERTRRSLIKHPRVGTIAVELASYQVLDDPSLTLRLYTPLSDNRSAGRLKAVIKEFKAKPSKRSPR